MEPLPTRGRLNGRVALSYTLVLKERKVGHEAPASQVRGFLLTAALIGDFDIHGARNEREETNAAGVPKGGVTTLVAVANAMAAETRQQPNNPEAKPWP